MIIEDMIDSTEKFIKFYTIALILWGIAFTGFLIWTIIKLLQYFNII